MNSRHITFKTFLIMLAPIVVLSLVISKELTSAEAADLTEKKVTLDPGHGWADSFTGAAANGMIEKDVALEIANLVKPMLEAQGVQVFMTRSSDEPNLGLSYAAIRANDFQSDLVVSIHLNGGGGTGTESCYQVVGSCNDPFSSACIDRPANENSKKLAGLLTQKVNQTLGLTIRGDFPEHWPSRCDRYASTGWTQLYIHNMNAPAAVIETAFIDGPADVDVKMLKERRGDFAKAISDAILAYLDISSINETKVTDIPNPDSYACSQPGYVDFEGLPDEANLSSGTIAGMQFTTTNGYSWLVGDFATGEYNGKYPDGAYTSQGTHWAWLGETQGAGRIDFPKGPASYFSLLVSNNTAVYLDAYSASGEKLATAGPSESNLFSGHMTELKIKRAIADIAYVLVHDEGNFFEIDSVCTNAPGTPNTIKRIVDETYFMETGDHSFGSFWVDFVAGTRRFLHIFIGPFFSDVDLVLTRPNGTIVSVNDPGVTFNKTANFIEVTIDGASAGDWQYEIIANELEPGGEAIRIVVDEESILQGPTFDDVSQVYWAWEFVERLYGAQITGGCNLSPLRYCPETSVTRAQMAVFLLRGIHGASYMPPGVGNNTGYGDVPTTYWAAAWIKQLAAEGITGGCGTNLYCPEAPVTRAQMAVFLLRSMYGASYNPPAVGSSTGFTDVPADYWAGAWIKQLIAESITSGCGTGAYCPEQPVTRAEMAVFLVRTFNLP